MNGFLTDAIRLPDDHIFIYLLTNVEKPFPDLLAYQLAAIAAGRPYEDPKSISLPQETLEKYSTVYHVAARNFNTLIRLQDGKLIATLPMAFNKELKALSETDFFISNSAYRLSFQLNPNREAMGFLLNGLYGLNLAGVRTNKPLPNHL